MIKAYAGCVVVEPMASPSTSPGGIIIPESAKRTLFRGRVVSAGPTDAFEFDDECFKLECGTVVYFKPEGVYEIEYDGQKYFVVEECDLLAFVDGEDEDE